MSFLPFASKVISRNILLSFGRLHRIFFLFFLKLCQGLPPKIVLPDIQSGNKPVAIPTKDKKISAVFPTRKKKFPGFIHHEVSWPYNSNLTFCFVLCFFLMYFASVNHIRLWNLFVTIVFNFKLIYPEFKFEITLFAWESKRNFKFLDDSIVVYLIGVLVALTCFSL